MPHPCPHHCPPGGSGAGAALVVLAVIVIAAIARPVVHAVSLVLEVTVIAAASVAGLGAIGGIALLVLRARRRQARTLQAMSRHTPIAQPAAETLSAPRRLAIEAARPSLADLRALAAEHGYDIVVRRDAED